MKAIVLLVTGFLLYGCSTTTSVNHIPVSSVEFTRPYSELKEKYTDIAEYEKWYRSPANSPNVSGLIEVWGEPDITKKNWIEYAAYLGLLLFLGTVDDYPKEYIPFIFAVSPFPREKYIWNKGNYEITASSRNDVWVKYQRRLYRWKWRDTK